MVVSLVPRLGRLLPPTTRLGSAKSCRSRPPAEKGTSFSRSRVQARPRPRAPADLLARGGQAGESTGALAAAAGGRVAGKWADASNASSPEFAERRRQPWVQRVRGCPRSSALVRWVPRFRICQVLVRKRQGLGLDSGFLY